MATIWEIDVWDLRWGQRRAVICSVHGVSHDDGEDYEFPFPASRCPGEAFEGEYFFVDVFAYDQD